MCDQKVQYWSARRAYVQSATQFLRFALVGVVGFVADAGVLRLVVSALGFNLYAGRVVSFLVAVTVTWALNRVFTFRHTGARAAQWLRFVCANSLGGAANFGVYALLVGTLSSMRENPTVAVACGSLVGMGLNFTLMKRVVFR
jgi:putative flippase GtrA